jgi:hypothetical protein
VRWRSRASAIGVAAACAVAAIVSWPGVATQDPMAVTTDAIQGIYST